VCEDRVGGGGMSLGRTIAYLGCAFSIGMFSAFNNFTLSLWLTGFTTSYVLINVLGNGRSLLGAVVSPLAGAWSDRIWAGWLGRRRPFILAGGLASALLLALTPLAGRLVATEELGGVDGDLARVAPIVGMVLLFTLTFNTMDDLHKALLADLTDGAEQNRLSALSVVVNIGGQVGILVLGFLIWSERVPDSAFVLAAALMAGGLLLTVVGLREPPLEVWAAERRRTEGEGGERLSLRMLRTRYRGALVFCLVNFCYWSGVNAVLPLVSIYTVDILGATTGEAQLLPALLLLSTTLLAIPMGWLGTKLGKARVLSAGFTIMGLAAMAGLLITTKLQGAALFFLAGIGNSAVIVLAIPLLADLVPRHHMGVASGFLAASGSIAAPLASVVAGSLSELYGPRAIFGVMAVMTGVAVGLMRLVRTNEGLRIKN
jgi:maltose/moltooligosaccharide transporter